LEGKNSSGLLVYHRAETSFALNDDIGHTHFAAERGEEDNELNGVNVVRDDDEVGLLGLDKSNTMVETVLYE
jgi:hypothetical protein